MSTYRFRLDTLLKMRQTVRDQRREELAQAFQAEQIVRRQQDEIAQESEQTNDQIRRGSQPGNVKVDNLLDAHRYERVIEARQNNLDAQRQQLEEEIARRRERLVEADREVRALEKLDERQRQEHNQNEHRREVRQMDEIAARVTQNK